MDMNSFPRNIHPILNIFSFLWTSRARRKRIFVCRISLWMLILIGMLPTFSTRAQMTELDDTAMENVYGQQGFSEFTIEGNTARVFFDFHIEQYQTIDQLKMGYYGKSDTGFKPAGYDYTHENLMTTKYAALNMGSNYTNTYGFVPALGLPLYTGKQGTGKNQNFHDWDINWSNVQLGKSETEPMTINGLICKVEFDDINSPNKKLKRVIIGTNDQRGYFAATMNRSSGMFNPLNTSDILARSNGNANPANGHPVLLKRDSMLTNWDHYVFNSGDHDTGFWVILNLTPNGPNGETDHIGWEVITGYDERAVDFSYHTGIENLDLSGY